MVIFTDPKLEGLVRNSKSNYHTTTNWFFIDEYELQKDIVNKKRKENTNLLSMVKDI